MDSKLYFNKTHRYPKFVLYVILETIKPSAILIDGT